MKKNAINDYLTKLINYATNTENNDSFAKVPLFSAQGFEFHSVEELKKLLDALITLIENENFKEDIFKHINKCDLISVYLDLYHKFYDVTFKNFVIKYTNEILKEVKKDLTLESNQEAIPLFDIALFSKHYYEINKFITLVNKLKESSLIHSIDSGKFTICATRYPLSNTTELGKCLSLNCSLLETYKKYNDPYEYLLSLKNNPNIPNDIIYKAFIKIDYCVKNEFGLDVSGGERSEFNLNKLLSDAEHFDMLLIDEPESSFDNIFLKEDINTRIKKLSQIMPVFISTHNNVVGVSIKADYIIYTQREIDANKKYHFKVFGGKATASKLYNSANEYVENYIKQINCFEGGEDSYQERNNTYGNIKNTR